MRGGGSRAWYVNSRANGTPNFSAALAAWASPFGHIMPPNPHGESAIGIVTFCPTIWLLQGVNPFPKMSQ